MQTRKSPGVKIEEIPTAVSTVKQAAYDFYMKTKHNCYYVCQLVKRFSTTITLAV